MKNTFIKDIHNKSIHVGDTVKMRPYINKEYTGKVVFDETISDYVIVNNSNEVVGILSRYSDLEIVNKAKGE